MKGNFPFGFAMLLCFLLKILLLFVCTVVRFFESCFNHGIARCRFSIVSRSATGPPCGKRIVAGRIVKESYGAAKQQHTFTVSSKSMLSILFLISLCCMYLPAAW